MTPRMLPALLALLFAPSIAAAVCPVTSACNNASAFLGNAACCGAQNCTLDGTVTLSGTTCTLDFDGRNVLISGTLNVGSRTLQLNAASVTITGTVNAKGPDASTPGGNVFITTRGAQPTAVRLASGSTAPRIDVSGGGRGAGVVLIRADGPVDLAGRIEASALALAPTADGGSVTVDSSGSIALTASINALGGAVAAGGSIDLTSGAGISLAANVRLSANGGDGGGVSLDAIGAVTLVNSARIEASGLSANGGFGGGVDVTAGSVDIAGVLECEGGGDPNGEFGGDGGEINIDVTTGALVLSPRSQPAIIVDGAGGGNAGIVNLSSGSKATGQIRLEAQVSAIGRGGSSIRPGGGGEISIESARELIVSKVIDAHGTGAGSGEIDIFAERDVTLNAAVDTSDAIYGGILAVQAGHDVIANADLRARATVDGTGGLLSISGGRDVVLKKGAKADASSAGAQPGGDVSIDGGRHVVIERDAEVAASTPGRAQGGAVDIRAGFLDLAGNLTVDGKVTATGSSTVAGANASILLHGCQVSIGGAVDSRGDTGSLNTITARSAITVAGTVRTTATGSNTLVFPAGLNPSFGNNVSPPFASASRPVCTGQNVPANCLVPCPNCGDGNVQFPEQCEPGVAGCSSCSNRCRTRTCNDGQPCTNDTCDNEFGCINEPKADGVACADTNPCTIDEMCLRGGCFGAPNPCDDDSQCTTDACNAQGCTHTAISCNDNNPCTLGDSCDPQSGCVFTGLKPCPTGQVCNPGDGACVPKPCQNVAACADNNPCTSEACTGGFCNITPVANGTECDDDTNRCNGVALCEAGLCEGRSPCDPDDGNDCTEDACVPNVGCTNTEIPGCCLDENDCDPVTVCTTCTDHVCGAEPGCCTNNTDCDDGNPCTDDGACDLQTNRCAASTPVSGRDCGTLCAPAECVAGVCEAGTPVTCQDDGDICTDDFCDPASGNCTSARVEGCCVGTPGECGDVCNFCDLATNRCTSLPECIACTSDIDCDPAGRCVDAGQTGGFNACGPEGKCIAVPAVDCNDNNPGTNDVCAVDAQANPVCRHLCLNNAACDDANACNGVETCNAGTCTPGTPLACDDGNACTIDECNATQGCIARDAEDFASVRCELDNIAAALAAASGTDIAAPIRAKIERILGKARAKLDAAEAAGPGKKAQKALAAVKAQAKMIRGIVKQAVRKRKIAPALAEALLGASDGASRAAQALRAQLRT